LPRACLADSVRLALGRDLQALCVDLGLAALLLGRRIRRFAVLICKMDIIYLEVHDRAPNSSMTSVCRLLRTAADTLAATCVILILPISRGRS
jgi:hypothetical protein